MNKDMKELIIDFLDGNLEGELARYVEEKIAEDEHLAREYASLMKLHEVMGNDKLSDPPERLRSGFYDFLETEKKAMVRELPKGSLTPLQYIFRAAAVLALIAMSIWGGIIYQKNNQTEQLAGLQEEIRKNREALLQLMERPPSSASARMSAVYNNDHIESGDEQIMKALFYTLNYDPNTNVRLAAFEAIERYTDNPLVLRELIASLKFQDNPTIQIAIIHHLVELREMDAIEPLQQLVEDENTEQFVKDEARMGLFKLS